MEKRINKIVFIIVVIAVGELGIDRFMRGQTMMGVLKLVTCGGLGVWWLIDVIGVLTRMSKYDEEIIFIDGEYKE
ncbi:MAG: TM2 domain-containing protein [Defluviitaleaceae bacterium]|nr:TM2 domain-containing protein [Defluviitaleaceae bacterium]